MKLHDVIDENEENLNKSEKNLLMLKNSNYEMEICINISKIYLYKFNLRLFRFGSLYNKKILQMASSQFECFLMGKPEWKWALTSRTRTFYMWPDAPCLDAGPSNKIPNSRTVSSTWHFWQCWNQFINTFDNMPPILI